MKTLALAFLLTLAPTPFCGFAQQTPAKATVESFAALDAGGARLESGPTDPIWKLTADDGESPVQPVVLIDSFKVMSEAASNTVLVHYAVRGVVKDNGGAVSFVQGHRVEVGRFTLVKTDDGSMKISERKLRLSPHVTRAAYLQHLDKLLALYDPKKDSSDPRYRSLLHLREVLQRLSAPGK